MREKLIELIVNCENEIFKAQPHITDESRIVALAEYLLTNEVIVPPCKVGDKVYALLFDDIPEEHWVIDELTVTEVGTKGVWVSGTYPAGDDMGMFISLAEFGEEVFLSREEAERTLKTLNQHCTNLTPTDTPTVSKEETVSPT